jgi:hypothetical protein
MFHFDERDIHAPLGEKKGGCRTGDSRAYDNHVM